MTRDARANTAQPHPYLLCRSSVIGSQALRARQGTRGLRRTQSDNARSARAPLLTSDF